MFLWLFLVTSVLAEDVPSLLEICYEPLDRGTPGPNAGIKFYFDHELAMCFPYGYEGVGGGKNTFATEQDCRSWCVAQDLQTCGGNKEPTGSCLEWENFSCPKDTICRRGGLGVGLCCDAANEAEWDREFNPTCSSGYSVVTKKVWWGEVPVRGRRCVDEFCPDESQCFEGKWIAHCCQIKGSGEIPQNINEDSPYQ